MKIDVVGAGPAGLYFAMLTKRRRPDISIDVYEQHRRDATYGFGIVIADRGLDRLRRADEPSFRSMMAAMYATRHQSIVHREETVFIERVGFGVALPRLRLLQILRTRCAEVGVRIHDEARIDRPDAAADIVVGADGVNSAVRRGSEQAFGTSSFLLTNRLAWYGTRRHFAYPTLVFRETLNGSFVAAAYAYGERWSTFVAECDAATWTRSGLDAMTEAQRRALTEEVFAPELAGEPLVSNGSAWRQLPVIRNRRWSDGNKVLIGDALHSAHPTIGSGTRIALDDAIALSDAVVRHGDERAAAFAAFQASRQPVKQTFLDATERSFNWYEAFPDKMKMFGPVDFAFDFMMRTGRVTDERLAVEFPDFLRRYGPQRSAPASSVTEGIA